MEKELNLFLQKAHRAGYADEKKEHSTSLRPLSKDYHYEGGDFSYHDTYFGGHYFIGAEVVYKNNIPIWGMNYYGKNISSKKDKEIYPFLREALSQDCDDLPNIRGPKFYKKDFYEYAFNLKGNLQDFSGIEEIFYNGEKIYQCLVCGGLIEE